MTCEGYRIGRPSVTGFLTFPSFNGPQRAGRYLYRCHHIPLELANRLVDGDSVRWLTAREIATPARGRTNMRAITQRTRTQMPMTPKARRTSAQVLAEQKADAERERAAKQAALQRPIAKPPQDEIERLTTKPATAPAALTAVAAPDARSSVQKYLDEVAPANIVGRMIKFSKEGKFVTSDDDESISGDMNFIVLADQTLIGWIKFNGEGEPPDRRMGLLYDGFVLPQREELGDDNEVEWELGLDGKPADPWQHHMYLVLQRVDTGEMFTFVTSSKTGRRAVGNLLRHYNTMQRKHPDMYPVAQLKTGGYQHKDDRVGWVNTPMFVVTGRTSKDDASKPAALREDMNDQIPI